MRQLISKYTRCPFYFVSFAITKERMMGGTLPPFSDRALDRLFQEHRRSWQVQLLWSCHNPEVRQVLRRPETK